MENFILIVLAILIGYILKRLKVFPSNSAVTLNQFVIYISLPAMILLQIPQLTLSMDWNDPLYLDTFKFVPSPYSITKSTRDKTIPFLSDIYRLFLVFEHIYITHINIIYLLLFHLLA